MKKVDVLTKKHEMMYGTFQHARASARELAVEKRKADACLKSSVLEAQTNLSKVQKKSAAMIKKLEKQTDEKMSKSCNEHQSALEQEKVSCSHYIDLFNSPSIT